jgi:purine-cytosine permease-like protein
MRTSIIIIIIRMVHNAISAVRRPRRSSTLFLEYLVVLQYWVTTWCSVVNVLDDHLPLRNTPTSQRWSAWITC